MIPFWAVSTFPSRVSSPDPGDFPVSFNGGVYTWTVPTGVTSIIASVWGSGGGGGNQSASPALKGGAGGYVKGTIAVSPGETLTIVVGIGGITPGNGGGASYIYKSGVMLGAGGGGGGATGFGAASGGGQGLASSPTAGTNGTLTNGGVGGVSSVIGATSTTAEAGGSSTTSQLPGGASDPRWNGVSGISGQYSNGQNGLIVIALS